MLVRMNLKKVLTESKIKINAKNKTAKFLREMKNKNDNMMSTTRPVTKGINMKRK